MEQETTQCQICGCTIQDDEQQFEPIDMPGATLCSACMDLHILGMQRDDEDGEEEN